MVTINIPSYLSHLLLMPQFPIVKTLDITVHEGDVLNIAFGSRDVEMGTAEVVAVKLVQAAKIPATFCQYLTGKNQFYLLGILKKQYGVEPNHTVQVLVLKWSQRHLPAHEEHLKSWWDRTVENTPGYEQFKNNRHATAI
jgi:hypothetical protein